MCRLTNRFVFGDNVRETKRCSRIHCRTTQRALKSHRSIVFALNVLPTRRRRLKGLVALVAAIELDCTVHVVDVSQQIAFERIRLVALFAAERRCGVSVQMHVVHVPTTIGLSRKDTSASIACACTNIVIDHVHRRQLTVNVSFTEQE